MSLNNEDREMLVEIRTAVCGRGGVQDRLDKVEAEVKEVQKWKWYTTGIAAAASFIINLLFGTTKH